MAKQDIVNAAATPEMPLSDSGETLSPTRHIKLKQTKGVVSENAEFFVTSRKNIQPYQCTIMADTATLIYKMSRAVVYLCLC